ncbi:DNA adenine methylase [Spirulina sp. CS-785/01]|uniref:DNA adenine methylase n=1 Tax=Spirulina sp. CS-785/01 TaxID=3021716 RepID=UPI00232CBBC2|nr:DNA adenine methylase [Spirulina sp. CS-785/01]MDB9314223.1 DNA adenine methylase [Spirulina sp. CS-785/01]
MAQIRAKPVLKWAGGKSKLLSQIKPLFPPELKQGKIKRYIEPFVGGGAVFLDIAQCYPKVEEFFILDINPELIIAYTSIQQEVNILIDKLTQIESNYLSFPEAQRKDYFYQIRTEFNQTRHQVNIAQYGKNWLLRTAQLIFLNKTCFNGLFRVNSKGEFNVPQGKYKNPKICDPDNLKAVSQILQKTTLKLGDYRQCCDWVDPQTFVYFDPPYRPISKTANFTAYSSHSFKDEEQLQLRDFFVKLDQRGAKLLLSNSDPKNEDQKDNFFDLAYEGYNVKRIKAGRSINSNASKRGLINEVVITNYN